MDKKITEIEWGKFGEETINLIFSFQFVKRAILLISLILLTFPIANFLLNNNEFIYNPESNLFLIIYIVFIFLLLCGFLLLARKGYRLGYWEFLGGFFLIIIYSLTRCPESSSNIKNPNWSYETVYGPINYFDPPLLILAIFLLGSVLFTIYNYIKKFQKNVSKNTFLEDNPISDKELEEDTSYNHLISKIAPALFQDVYETSFTIGVIGPWGTGKSSFLGAVKHAVLKSNVNDLKTKYQCNIGKKPDTIFIEFSPFLNHNEEQVIHEFFTQLSNKLGEKSGRLSNLISVYSEKLANLDGYDSWFSIFNLAKNSRENKSAKELYDEIKSCIEELNLKIIVTVDDLDRLNAKEILQVLKLIRNTSNFPNTVFLVAMDKEYVMRTLGEESNYAYRDYIEKFFQVEMVIKQPSYFDVVKRVVKEAEQTKDINKSNLEEFEKVLTASSSESLKIIFGNYRSAIKLMNQAIIDDKSIPNLFTEIDIKDYFMFTYLEMNFPKFYGKLTSEPKLFLVEDSEGKFRLKEKQKNNEDMSSADVAKEITSARIGSIIEQFRSEKNFNFDDFDFGSELENPINELKFTRAEAEIIKNIFIEVFKEESKSKKSLRFTSKFFTLIRLKIDEKEISETDFNKIVKDACIAKSMEEYDDIIKDTNLTFKSNSLVKKLNDKDSRGKNKEEYLALFSLLLIIYGKLFNENSINHNLFNLIDAFFDIPGFNKNSEIDHEYLGLKNSIEKYWIENPEVSNAVKLKLIFSIKENDYLKIREHFNKLWSDDEYDKVCIKLFSQYLREYQDKEWAINDLNFIGFLRMLHRNLKKVSYSTIQTIVIDHFQKAPIENFCLQLLSGNYNNIKHSHQISNDLLLVFDSNIDFYVLLIERILRTQETKPNLIKFLHVLEFYLISHEIKNEIYVVEIFDEKEIENNDFKEVNQLIFESYDDAITDLIEEKVSSNSILTDPRLTLTVLKSKYFKPTYLVFDIYVNNDIVIQGFMKEINNLFKTFSIKEDFEIDNLIDNFRFFDKENKLKINIVSFRTANRK